MGNDLLNYQARYGVIAAALAHAIQDSRLPISFDIDQTIAALERARVVGVLDAWADERKLLATPSPKRRPARLGGGFVLFLTRTDAGYIGETRDSARAAAAKAIEAGEV